MGCATSTVAESKGLSSTTNGQGKAITDVFKIADDVCFIPTDMLLNNAIQSSPKEQMRVAMQPNELIIKIGDMAVDLYKNQGLMKFKIAFYEEFLPKELQQWMKQIHNFINVYIRRKTSGKLYGIYKYEIVNEEIEAYMCVNNAYYLGLNKFKERPELDELIELISSYLYQSFSNDQFFIEMIYDPLIIPQQQIQQVLKEMSKCYGSLQKEFPLCRFTTVRKLNQMQLFSFIILIFDTSNINRFISGQFKFRVPSQFPKPISNSLRAQYEYKSLFTQLLTNATVNDLCYYIIEKINDYQQEIEIPLMVKFQEAFMAMFSQIMCIQFPDVMENKMLTAIAVTDRYVTKIRVEPIDVEQRKKVEQLLQYIASLSGQQYKDVILGLYYTGDLNLNKIKSGGAAEEAAINDEMLDIRAEQGNEIVFALIDAALKQYFLGQKEIIPVDLSAYDPTIVKQHMVFIRKELGERLQGRDSVECGVTLDGDVYMRIFKDTHVGQEHRRRRKRARAVENPREQSDPPSDPPAKRPTQEPLDVDPQSAGGFRQPPVRKQDSAGKQGAALQMLFDGL